MDDWDVIAGIVAGVLIAALAFVSAHAFATDYGTLTLSRWDEQTVHWDVSRRVADACTTRLEFESRDGIRLWFDGISFQSSPTALTLPVRLDTGVSPSAWQAIGITTRVSCSDAGGSLMVERLP